MKFKVGHLQYTNQTLAIILDVTISTREIVLNVDTVETVLEEMNTLPA